MRCQLYSSVLFSPYITQVFRMIIGLQSTEKKLTVDDEARGWVLRMIRRTGQGTILKNTTAHRYFSVSFEDVHFTGLFYPSLGLRTPDNGRKMRVMWICSWPTTCPLAIQPVRPRPLEDSGMTIAATVLPTI